MASQLETNTTTMESLISAINNLPSGSTNITLQEKTISPTTSSQSVVPDSGYDGLSKVIVDAIPNTYVKPTATKAVTTYTPTTSNQTIAAGTYCSGVQTIKGDSNLVAGNIKSGVSIFGVAGSYEGTGSGSSESLFSIGELTSSLNQTFGAGATIFSVTGLGFKPKHVMVYIKGASSSVTLNDSSTKKKLLTFCQCGYNSTLISCQNGASQSVTYINRSPDDAHIDITDDGFVLISDASNVYTTFVSYEYIAFG